jgi:hypothetical protein
MAKKNFVGPKGARLLRRVAKHILAEPLRYNQDAIIERGEPGYVLYDLQGQIVPQCGTIACIGGWMALLSADNPKRVRSFSVPKLKRALELPRGETDRVFRLIAYTWTEHYGWPPQFRNAYNNAATPMKKAQIAHQRIEHFIKTGE